MNMLNLLVVEDDPIQRKTLRKLIEHLGSHCVFDCASLTEAASILKSTPEISGAFIDLVLQDGNGLEVAKLCAEHDVLTVFTTSTNDDHNSRLMWDYGPVLPKPVTLPMLAQALRFFRALKCSARLTY